MKSTHGERRVVGGWRGSISTLIVLMMPIVGYSAQDQTSLRVSELERQQGVMRNVLERDLEKLFAKAGRTLDDEERIWSEVALLGKIGDADSARVLVRHLAFSPEKLTVQSLHGDEVYDKYIVFHAIVRIGHQSLARLAELIADSSDEKETELARVAFHMICGATFEGNHAERQASGAAWAVSYLKLCQSRQSDGVKRARIEASIEYFKSDKAWIPPRQFPLLSSKVAG